MSSSIKRFGYTLSILAIGYLLGTSGSLISQTTNAQPAKAAQEDEVKIEISNEAVQQIQTAHEALALAMESMKQEGKYNSATESINPYLILTGGGDAIEDLKLGIGVDPMTFSALYAGKATQEIEDDLSWDDKNHLMYKNKLIRIYSIEKLAQRQKVLEALLAKRVATQE